MNYQDMKKHLEGFGQQHLLENWENLNGDEQTALLTELTAIDFPLLAKLYKEYQAGEEESGEIAPIKTTKVSDLTTQVTAGEEVIANGQLAVVTLAGGMGSRLGHKGPKGSFVLPEPVNLSLFEILAGNIRRNAPQPPHWCIMTSYDNHEDTLAFFEAKDYFGYERSKIHFFTQPRIPIMEFCGKVALDENGKIRMASNGNGAVFGTLKSSGLLTKLQEWGIKWVSVCGIDNVLVNPVDPRFVGLAVAEGNIAAGKSITKRDPHERVGVFAMRGGVPSVVEYFELTDEMRHSTSEDGEHLYSEGHILCNLYHTSLIEQAASGAMSYHFNTSSGVIKSELLNCDVFAMVDSISVLSVPREEEFSPLKSATGVDSVETATASVANRKN
ncbi:MAG: UTP--glucose-1-phosphate uridylyltransferase [Oscillospiraceae bacterium]|nr:UTP--glucose-1-phosphate uridylyltransferase [Oscillospiraceae bacterium]